MSVAPPIRVVIVDDHPMFRLGLAAAIAEMDGIDVIGEASRADELPPLLVVEQPDVVLLDVGLPDSSGIDLVRWLSSHHPDVRVLMITMSDDLDTALGALREGARGFLVKGANSDRVEHAIRTVAGGDVVLDQGLVAGVGELAIARRAAVTRPFPELTDREFEVLLLLAEGLNNAAIARSLVVNPKTVRNHVSNVLAKLQVPDRAGAIVLAHRHQLGS